MEASSVIIKAQTLAAGSKLSQKRRQKLRTQAVKELIRSKPAGTPITVQELMQAAGYDPVTKYATGFGFIKRLLKKRVIVCNDPNGKKYERSYSIPGDAKTSKPKPAADPEKPAGGVLVTLPSLTSLLGRRSSPGIKTATRCGSL